MAHEQINKHHGELNICDFCLNYFSAPELLEKHMHYCMNHNKCLIKLPKNDNGGNIMKFKSYQKKLIVPFIIYADIETLLKKPTKVFSKSTKTVAYQEHEPYSVGYYFKSAYEDVKQSYYSSKRSPDCIKWFVYELKRIAEEVSIILNDAKPLILTPMQSVAFLQATNCHICGKKYGKNENPVRDHSHLTGEYRGSAHNKCNLLHRETRTVPIIFHNLSRYDAHFLMETLANDAIIEGHLKIIAANSEVYISFTKLVHDPTREFKHRIRLTFIDSFRFMASSLDYLSAILPFDQKHILHAQWQNKLNEQEMKMLERKGVLCYDYIDSRTKLDDTQLHPKMRSTVN